MILYDNILKLIGNTPIVKIKRFPSGNVKKNIYVKLESFNPCSIKDRIAKKIVEEAERCKELRKNYIVLESSSGNTGIGLSMVCRVKGYRNIIVLDKNCPPEKIKMLRALGAQVVMLTTNLENCEDLTEKRIAFVNKVRERLNNLFIPNQYQNPDAPRAHYEATGHEVIDFIDKTGIKFDAVFISVGTGGTITGVSKRLKEYDPSIRIIGVEPDGSTLFGGDKKGYLQQGPGNYFVPDNLHYENIDEGLKVSDQHAFNTCRQLALKEGLLVGGSSGGVVYKAMQRADSFKGNVLCILPDGGEKYLDTIYSDEWLDKNGIFLEKENVNRIVLLNIDDACDYDELVDQLIKEMV